MKAKFLFLSFCVCLIFINLVEGTAQTDKKTDHIGHVGLFYPLSTHGAKAADYRNSFSFHVFSGVSGGEKAFALSGLSTLVKGSSKGLQLSGLYNFSENHSGIQIGGISNYVRKDARGLQLSGIYNHVNQLRGMQLTGLVNKSQSFSGLQFAGLGNIAHNANGIQFAGVANIVREESEVQFSGLVNVSQKTNSQFSGLLNIAGNVSGVQFAGLLNIADSSDYPLGLINLIKNGEIQIGYNIDETGTMLASLRSGGKYLYGIIGIGYNFYQPQQAYALEAGYGLHLPIAPQWRVNTEIVSSTMTDFVREVYFKSSARILIGYKVFNRIEFLIGPSFSHLGFDKGGFDLSPNLHLWERKGANFNNYLFVGGFAGIHLNL